MDVNYQLITEAGPDWRGCLMLSMPAGITALVDAYSQTNIPDRILASSGREDYCHCTILYGFSQETDFEEVKDFVLSQNLATLTLGLDKVKRFKADSNRPDSDVLVIEVKPSPAMIKLNSDLTTKFEVQSFYKTYNPHVTVAYIKPGRLTSLDGDTYFKNMHVISDDMVYSLGSSDNRIRHNISFNEFRNNA
jgi:2'-5' RNA ligase